MLTPLIVLAVASLASAQTTTTANPDAPPTSPSNQTMAGRYQDNAKENLYARFSDFKRNPNPEQQRYAYPTAKEYLRLWGGENTPEVKEVRKWVAEYERAMHQNELFAAYNAKDYAKTFALTRPLVKSDPEYFFAFAIMTEAGYDNSLTGKSEFNVEDRKSVV